VAIFRQDSPASRSFACSVPSGWAGDGGTPSNIASVRAVMRPRSIG
jgi:hypothetical protein